MMKHWATLSNEEKLDRLAESVFKLSKQIEMLMAHTNADVKPGYEILRIESTQELADAWLGVCPWTRKEAA